MKTMADLIAACQVRGPGWAETLEGKSLMAALSVTGPVINWGCILSSPSAGYLHISYYIDRSARTADLTPVPNGLVVGRDNRLVLFDNGLLILEDCPPSKSWRDRPPLL